MEWSQGEFIISDSNDRLDIERICSLLSNTYWAADRTRDVIEISVSNSLCFGVYHNGGQIGFARAVTDEAVSSWLCDIVIDEHYRGRGLGRWLVQCMLEHPEIKDTRQSLATRDAHGLYEKFGFGRTEIMRRG